MPSLDGLLRVWMVVLGWEGRRRCRVVFCLVDVGWVRCCDGVGGCDAVVALAVRGGRPWVGFGAAYRLWYCSDLGVY